MIIVAVVLTVVAIADPTPWSIANAWLALLAAEKFSRLETRL